MYKYKEFAPQTYLDLINSSVIVSVNGLLKWLITAPNFITSEKWNYYKLVSVAIANNIDLIFVNHNEISFAKNSHDEFKNEDDTKLNEVEFIDVKNLTKLIKLIDRSNKNNIYMEIMFKGFYLNLERRKLFFNLRELIYGYIRNPYNFNDYRKIHTDANDFKIFAKKNNINIDSINAAKIQFIPKSLDGASESMDTNTSTSSNVEVIDSAYLLKIGQGLNQFNKSQSDNKKDITYQYYEIGSGIIREKNQDQKFYSVTYALEALNNRMAKPAIKIGKNAIRKQIRNLINEDSNKYQKIELSSGQIEMHDKKWLAKNTRETYINETLFNAILDYNLAKNDKNYPMPEPKFDIEIPLLGQSFLNVKLPGNGKCKINYASFEAVQVQINRFKGNVGDIIELKKQWLINKLNNINVKVNYNSVSTSVKWSEFIAFIDELEKNQLIVTPFDAYKQTDINILKNLENIDSAKKDIDKLTLRKVFNVNLPEKLKNINKHKYDYFYTTDLSNKELQKISNYFGTNVKKIMDIVNKATQEIMKEMAKLDKI